MTSTRDDFLDIPTDMAHEELAPAVRSYAEPTPAERFARYAKRVGRRWRLVVLVTVVTGGVAALFSVLQHKQYDATATLYFPQTPTLNTALGIPTSLPADTEREANTNVALVTSPSVAQAVITQLGLKTSVPQLLARLQASVSGNSDLVSVTATGSSPSQASALANAFASEDVTFRREAVQASLSQAIAQATQALDSLPPGQRTAQGQALAARLQQLKAARDVQTGPAQLLQSATQPLSASSPRPLRTTALGLALGFLLAIGLALGLDKLDRRLKDEDELAHALHSTVLGAVPHARRSWPGAPLDPAQRRAAGMLASCLRLQGMSSGVVVLTGVGAADDQALVALGLAASLTKSGRTVLVIQVGDAGTGIDGLLGLVDRPGLGAALDDPGQWEKSLVAVNADRLTVVSRSERIASVFSVLPIGYASAEYSDLTSPAMQHLVASASSEADVVLVAVASVEETLAFVDESFATLLVARCNGTTRDRAAAAMVELRNARIRPRGLVVTGSAA
jgi:tyrosine-protein kinase